MFRWMRERAVKPPAEEYSAYKLSSGCFYTHTAACLCLKEDDLYRLPVDLLLLTVSLPENKAVCDLRIHTHTRHYPGVEAW